jgi:hypothetical protein
MFKYLNQRKKLHSIFLLTPLFFCLNLVPMLANGVCLSRREAATEYNNCDRQKEIAERIICITNLRNNLNQNCDSFGNIDNRYSRYELAQKLENYSSQQLQEAYQRERKLVQQYIARLTND